MDKYQVKRKGIQREKIYFLIHGFLGLVLLVCCIKQVRKENYDMTYPWLKLALVPLALTYFNSLQRAKYYKQFVGLKVHLIKFYWLFISLAMVILGLGPIFTRLGLAYSKLAGSLSQDLAYLQNLYQYVFLLFFFYTVAGFSLALDSPLTMDKEGRLSIHPAYKKEDQ